MYQEQRVRNYLARLACLCTYWEEIMACASAAMCLRGGCSVLNKLMCHVPAFVYMVSHVKNIFFI